MLPDLAEIKKKRKIAGLTQKELAKKAGVSQSLLAKIESRKTIPGYENAKKIFNAFELTESKKQQTALEIMNRKITTIKENTSLSKAAQTMKSKGFSQLPVMKARQTIGTVTEKNLINCIQGKKDLKKTKARDAMDEMLPIISQNTGIATITGLLENEQALLVKKQGKICGIITKTDLLKIASKKTLL